MTLTFQQLLQRQRSELNAATLEHNRAATELAELSRSTAPADPARLAEIRARQDAAGLRVRDLTDTIAAIQREADLDAADTAAANQRQQVQQPYGLGVITHEARTYSEHNDRRGQQFAVDVARSFLFGDPVANERLARHMTEERVERGGELVQRAAGTGAFTGLVVPQYLVDQFAPLARAGRPFADACRRHDLPDRGMTLSIGKGTTGTTVGLQSSENAAVSEQDYDDTLMTLNVLTAGGSQTLSRQSVERGEGVEDTVIDDLIRGYAVNIDSQLLNAATTGLTNVATSIAYTDASPTGAELYPKLLQGPAAAEAALLDQTLGNTIVVMHSRRWYWLQAQLTSTWPMFGQPGAAAQQAGVNYGERYGSGFRGLLPSGTPVIVDNNIATNLGAGTNEDEIYVVGQSEAHLWEDPNAPMLIRAEQTKAKNLGIDLVVYGYFAYTFTRRAHAQKIAGTGLVTPTW